MAPQPALSDAAAGGFARSVARNANLHGVFLHIVADLLQSVGNVLGTWAVEGTLLPQAHLVVAVLVACTIGWIALPLAQRTVGLLLLRAAPDTRVAIERCMRQISTLDGVLECRRQHWWSNAPGVTVGSLHVRVRSDADEHDVLSRVHGILRLHTAHLTVQIERDAPLAADWMLRPSSAIGPSSSSSSSLSSSSSSGTAVAAVPSAMGASLASPFPYPFPSTSSAIGL